MAKDPLSHIPAPPIHAMMKAGADPLRMQILKVLEQESFGVLELSEVLDSKQSGMSHHLKALAGAGLVTARREANAIFYQKAEAPLLPALAELQQAILNAAAHIGLDAETEQRMEDVLRNRVSPAEALFESYEPEFREQHEAISPYTVYGTAASQMLDKHLGEKREVVLEVGPGDGRFLTELSGRFQQVFALDTSAAMIGRAESRAEKNKITNVEFIHGGLDHSWVQGLQFDCIVMNMVLHHMAAPAKAFTEMSDILKNGGQLFICDLCSHNQRSAKDACGDVWLGFEAEQLSRWAELSGFEEGPAEQLSQRNGFNVQLRVFNKP